MTAENPDAKPVPKAATVIRWYRQRDGKPPLLVTESVRGWEPAPTDPANVDPANADPAAAVEPGSMSRIVPAAWTAELVRARLAEAMSVLKRLPEDATTRPSTCMVRWPDVVHGLAEAYGYGKARTVAKPTPAEIGRLDETLPWLFLIADGQQRLAVIGVAMGLNLRVIGRTFGCSHETVRQREKAGVAALVKALNSQP